MYFCYMKNLVILSGAGISAESGLKTFRDSDGLWEGYKIEEVATPEAWRQDPVRVLDFYNYRRQQVLAALPNEAHLGLARLERYFNVQIITQNIDDLHERAGSTNILHLHGEIRKMRSERDEDLIYLIDGDIHPGDLAEDGAQLRPHIVWFGEAVPMIERAIRLVEQADILVVIGTSLVVYPAAGLLHYAAVEIPKFIIDKNIPVSGTIPHLTKIALPATEGIITLEKMLEQYY